MGTLSSALSGRFGRFGWWVTPSQLQPTLASLPLRACRPNSGGDADLEFLQQCVQGYIAGVGYIKPNSKAGDFKDDFIYVNDEGLFNEEWDFIKMPGYAQELYRGNMLIVGSDGEGGTTDVKMTVEQVKNCVSFVAKENVRSNY